MIYTESYQNQVARIFETLYIEEWKKICKAEMALDQIDKSLQYYLDFIKPVSLNYIVFEPLSERFGLSPLNKQEFLIHLKKLEEGIEESQIVDSTINIDLLAFGKSILLLIDKLKEIRIKIENLEFERIGDIIIIPGISNPLVEYNEKESHRKSDVFFQYLIGRVYDHTDRSLSKSDYILKEKYFFSKLLKGQVNRDGIDFLKNDFIFDEETIDHLHEIISRNQTENFQKLQYTLDKKNIESYAQLLAIKKYVSFLESGLEEKEEEKNKIDDTMSGGHEMNPELPSIRAKIILESSMKNKARQNEKESEDHSFSSNEGTNYIDEDDLLNWINSEL